jgi:hypothetical protein
MKQSATRRPTAPATTRCTLLRSHMPNRIQCVAQAQFVMYIVVYTQILRYRASIKILSTRTLSKMRIARSMRRSPVVVYLHRHWAALQPSRYALPKLVKPLFEPPSCTGIQKIHWWWWWRRRRRRFADTADQHGYGGGVQALRSAWRFRRWREARSSQRRGYDCHQTSCPEQVWQHDWWREQWRFEWTGRHGTCWAQFSLLMLMLCPTHVQASKFM